MKGPRGKAARPQLGKGSHELRGLLDRPITFRNLASWMGTTPVDHVDERAAFLNFLHSWHTNPKLLRGLEAVRDAIHTMDTLDRQGMPGLASFRDALEKFTETVAYEDRTKASGSRRPPLRALSDRAKAGSRDRMMRYEIVTTIDKHLKGSAAVKAYQLAVLDYLGRDLESPDNDFAGDARREMRRTRRDVRDGVFPLLGRTRTKGP